MRRLPDDTPRAFPQWQKRNRCYHGPWGRWINCTEANARMLQGLHSWEVQVISNAGEAGMTGPAAASPGLPSQPRKATDEEIAAWVERHDLHISGITDAARAFEIADEAMFETLESEGLIRPGQDRGDTYRIPQPHYMGRAAFDEAVDWLKERGYVELGSDADGDFVSVIRRPGEDT